MPKYDRTILIKNIRKLMEDNKTTQSALANALGMTQSNVSKALSDSDKKNFTLDQLVGIADFFQTSADELLGITSSLSLKLTPREIARFLTLLIQNEDAAFAKHVQNEHMHVVDYDHISYDDGYLEPAVIDKEVDVSYLSIYFPSFWYVPDDLTQDQEEELSSEWSQLGNETRMRPVNKFLHDFKQIHEIYKNGGLEKETYETVVDDLLSHLRD